MDTLYLGAGRSMPSRGEKVGLLCVDLAPCKDDTERFLALRLPGIVDCVIGQVVYRARPVS